MSGKLSIPKLTMAGRPAAEPLRFQFSPTQRASSANIYGASRGAIVMTKYNLKRGFKEAINHNAVGGNRLTAASVISFRGGAFPIC
jgi:hypothetical protein